MKNGVKHLMSQKQLNRFSVISMALEAKVTVSEAAKSLGLSERQIKQIKRLLS